MPRRSKPRPATVVLLVRHGLTPTTGTEIPAPGPGPTLSDQGRAQAQEAGAHIVSLRATLPSIGAVYSSPLLRTRETADAVSRALGLAVVEDPALVDSDAGEWAGAPLKDLAKKPEWETVVHYPSGFRFPGGESIAQMQARVVSAVRARAAGHPGQTVVVVSHADPIKAVLADAMGVHLDLFQRVAVSPASVSAINYAEPFPTVMFVNWAPAQPQPPRAGGAGSAPRRNS